MDAPVGLFDSGIGGLTVMKELKKLLPNENIIYLADTANIPYGSKSPSEILTLAKINGQNLVKLGIKLLVIACHTASCHALELLQKELSIPVIGLIESALKMVQPYNKIVVLGTTSTIESKVYQELICKQNEKAEVFAIFSSESPAPPDALRAVFCAVHFNTDEHVVRDRNEIATLVNIANYLKKNPNLYVVVEGHCDERASASYNMALGMRRANAVRSFLVKNGADLNRIYTISRGKEQPIALGHSETHYKRNRRSEFRIYQR